MELGAAAEVDARTDLLTGRIVRDDSLLTRLQGFIESAEALLPSDGPSVPEMPRFCHCTKLNNVHNHPELRM